jgi:hypothetical protein
MLHYTGWLKWRDFFLDPTDPVRRFSLKKPSQVYTNKKQKNKGPSSKGRSKLTTPILTSSAKHNPSTPHRAGTVLKYQKPTTPKRFDDGG